MSIQGHIPSVSLCHLYVLYSGIVVVRVFEPALFQLLLCTTNVGELNLNLASSRRGHRLRTFDAS